VINVSDEDFQNIIGDAIDAIPPLYQKHLQNVAFIAEDYPTPAQRRQLNLYNGELLFGLYEGVPLPERFIRDKIFPDKITIFKKSAELVSNSVEELSAHIHHTVWHEVAHYYGLNHARIHELERKMRPPEA